jgi:hypothetical protein
MIRWITASFGITLGAFEFACGSFGHDIPVHQLITLNAAESVIEDSSNFMFFLNAVSHDAALKDATNFLVFGSGTEDNVYAPRDTGGARPYNHFYDPLQLNTNFGKGLSDLPFEIRALIGRNSFYWASTSNCLGINFGGINLGVVAIAANENTTNVWSWQNARNYEIAGLTASSPADRSAALSNMFRAVGQVMHLLEDASQPQHVRNEQHLVHTLSESAIEDYGMKHRFELNYAHSVLDWKGAGFTKLEDFWDRHAYQGTASKLDAETNAGTNTLGMAEWCNGNFLGGHHLYAEYYQPGSIEYYPFPSRNSSTDYLQVRAHLHSAVQPLSLKNGQQGQAIYLRKTGDGVQMAHHSRFTYFGAKFLGFGMITINDSNVLSDYHNAFIPKAVSYAAGLIDYYFRGSLGVGTSLNSDGTWNLQITNTSRQDFSGGSFRLFYDDSYGNRTELTDPDFTDDYTNALPVGGKISANANLGPGIVNCCLVYQGTIGTSGGSASDPVDDGLAIAVSSFQVGPGDVPGGSGGATLQWVGGQNDFWTYAVVFPSPFPGLPFTDVFSPLCDEDIWNLTNALSFENPFGPFVLNGSPNTISRPIVWTGGSVQMWDIFAYWVDPSTYIPIFSAGAFVEIDYDWQDWGLFTPGTYGCTLHVDTADLASNVARFYLVSEDGTQRIEVTSHMTTVGSEQDYPPGNEENYFIFDSTTLFGRATRFYPCMTINGIPHAPGDDFYECWIYLTPQ